MTGKRRPLEKRTGHARPPRGTAGKTPARDPAYEPARTPLGAEIRRLRAAIIESGEKLLDWEDVEREVADRRGGVR